MKKFKPQTSKGPTERFAGSIYPTIIFTGDEPSRARMASVHFEPGAHTAWHKHAVGQYIHVMEGIAYMQERGRKPNVLKPEETIYTEPGVEHWHGASSDSFMVHIVVWEAPGTDGVEETTWLQHVTEDEYNNAAKNERP